MRGRLSWRPLSFVHFSVFINHLEDAGRSIYPQLALRFRPHVARPGKLFQKSLHKGMKIGRLVSIVAAAALLVLFVLVGLMLRLFSGNNSRLHEASIKPAY